MASALASSIHWRRYSFSKGRKKLSRCRVLMAGSRPNTWMAFMSSGTIFSSGSASTPMSRASAIRSRSILRVMRTTDCHSERRTGGIRESGRLVTTTRRYGSSSYDSESRW